MCRFTQSISSFISPFTVCNVLFYCFGLLSQALQVDTGVEPEKRSFSSSVCYQPELNRAKTAEQTLSRFQPLSHTEMLVTCSAGGSCNSARCMTRAVPPRDFISPCCSTQWLTVHTAQLHSLDSATPRPPWWLGPAGRCRLPCLTERGVVGCGQRCLPSSLDLS